MTYAIISYFANDREGLSVLLVWYKKPYFEIFQSVLE